MICSSKLVYWHINRNQRYCNMSFLWFRVPFQAIFLKKKKSLFWNCYYFSLSWAHVSNIPISCINNVSRFDVNAHIMHLYPHCSGAQSPMSRWLRNDSRVSCLWDHYSIYVSVISIIIFNFVIKSGFEPSFIVLRAADK